MAEYKSSDKEIECTTECETSLVRLNVRFRWKVTVRNVGTKPRHMVFKVCSYKVIDDRTLEISTAPPLFAEGIHTSILPVPKTIAVNANQTVDREFELTLPLRFGKFNGFPPKVEMEEWQPQGDLEIRTVLAHAPAPFYPPTDPKKLNEELQRWASVTAIPPINLRFDNNESNKD